MKKNKSKPFKPNNTKHHQRIVAVYQLKMRAKASGREYLSLTSSFRSRKLQYYDCTTSHRPVANAKLLYKRPRREYPLYQVAHKPLQRSPDTLYYITIPRFITCSYSNTMVRWFTRVISGFYMNVYAKHACANTLSVCIIM